MNEIADKISDSYAFSEERSELIAQTEIAMANQAGALEGMHTAKEAGVNLTKIWLPDAEACDECLDNGDAGPIELDEEFPSGDDAPPAHPNCFLPGTSVTALGVTKAYKRWFQGKIIVITLPNDISISVTPNHPILTQRGWVEAGSLQITDALVQLVDPIAPSAIISPDNDYVKTSIEKIADSLLVTKGGTTTTVPTSTKDFHGDGIANGKVDIIRPASPLPNQFRSIASEPQTEREIDGSFSKSHSQRLGFPSKSALTQFIKRSLATTDSFMGSSNTSPSVSHADPTCLHSTSVALATNSKTKNLESLSQGPGSTTNTISNINAAFASNIRFVQIADLIVTEFSGHVYNLETVAGWYLAHSIIVSNCRCSLISEIDESGQETEEEE